MKWIRSWPAIRVVLLWLAISVLIESDSVVWVLVVIPLLRYINVEVGLLRNSKRAGSRSAEICVMSVKAWANWKLVFYNLLPLHKSQAIERVCPIFDFTSLQWPPETCEIYCLCLDIYALQNVRFMSVCQFTIPHHFPFFCLTSIVRRQLSLTPAMQTCLLDAPSQTSFHIRKSAPTNFCLALMEGVAAERTA